MEKLIKLNVGEQEAVSYALMCATTSLTELRKTITTGELDKLENELTSIWKKINE